LRSYNMLKRIIQLSVLMLLTITNSYTFAEFNQRTFLKPGAQSKIGIARAKKYATSGGLKARQARTQINLGSKKAGTCVMNVGRAKKGTKNVVVAAETIINYCGR